MRMTDNDAQFAHPIELSSDARFAQSREVSIDRALRTYRDPVRMD
jgi:hypothetical protein